MKKNTIAVILLTTLWSHILHGQDYSRLVSAKGGIDGTETFNVVPPSPESYFKTQYGNTAFNEFKGTPNLTIPLHEITSGSLKLPVALNYFKAGVKVNDVPNSVGMNWILEAGGVINRTIYDLTDEIASQRVILNASEFGYLSSQDGAQTLGIYTHDISGSIDNEIDIFSFSVQGYNGSFYLDKNFKPILLTQNYNVKIETLGDFKQNFTFIITANDGTEYTFGGTNAIEKTWVRLDNSRSGNTSFYLTKIKDTSNNEINFLYTEVSSKIIQLGEEEIGMINSQSSSSGTLITAPSGVQVGTFSKKLNITNPKILTKIIGKNEEINFNYITELNSPFQKLGNIVISQNGINIKKIVFDYINSTSTSVSKKRFFLTSVKEYTISNNTETFTNEYSLEYDAPLDIPERLSKKIDYLGYFNGSNNNSSLLPNLNLFGEHDSFFDQSIYYADRRANFEFAKKGTLKSITYPTKGKTVFEYESLQAKKSVIKERNCVIGNTNTIYHPVLDENEWYPLSNESSFVLQPSEITGNKVTIDIHLHSDAEINQPSKAKAIFEIIDQSNNQVVYSKLVQVQKMVQNASFSYVFQPQPNKAYQFKYKIADLCKQCNGVAAVVYDNGWTKIEDANIRLKKQYDLAENGPVNIKRFYYADYKNISNMDIIGLPFQPYFRSYAYNQIIGVNSLPHECLTCFASSYTSLFHSEPQISNIFTFSESGEQASFDIYDPVYPQVTISYGGDNFEKGGEEKKFDTEAYTVENSLPLKYPNEDGMAANTQINNATVLGVLSSSAMNKLYRHFPLNNISSRLISHRIFSNKNGNLFLKKSTQNIYNSILEGNIYSVAGIQIYPYIFTTSTANPSTTLNNMYVEGRRFPTYSSFLNDVTSTEYLEDVPINTTDDTTYKKITTITNYLYNNPDKQVSRSVTSFSDFSIQETVYQYAAEKGNQKLINANMIGIPLETVVTKKQDSNDAFGKTISRRETRYDDPLTLLPTSILSYNLQNNMASIEITYDQYDAKGNLRQYTTKDGIPTAIVWGYNNTKPIAKVEGVTYQHLSENYPVMAEIISASDTDANAGTNNDETSFLSALQKFRSKLSIDRFRPLVSTYTYDPLIGVRTITPPSGIRENYIYDSANRLEKVTDMDGKILKEIKYNYKN
ncbi:hypothetical protein LF887_14650 [Chryseobacterium sp. MEBOG06]|uniref:hypothetical protein n=1 Tax=Chryseobacterium sp. MEBOG06 TaxID=2879938 RepID=UPI001F3AFA13|nr:hypothetical protein [Chryseobacterium sp. MEBOG06]UKB82244.1 hypothetical protein LF887_14650 [Chryseobacterium sp. MEBOG06]